MIGSGKLLAVGSILPRYLNLRRHRSNAPLVQHNQLCTDRLNVNAAFSSVVAYTRVVIDDGGVVNYDLVDDRMVIHVMHDVGVDIIDRPVVSEPVMVPIAPVVAASGVTKSIIDAAVKTYM